MPRKNGWQLQALGHQVTLTPWKLWAEHHNRSKPVRPADAERTLPHARMIRDFPFRGG
ncbi:hypothetical protein [Streptomyces sp. NPDC001275]